MLDTPSEEFHILFAPLTRFFVRYSSFFSASDQGQQKAHKPPPSSSSAPYSSSNYRDRMAWERERAKAAHSLSQDTTMERMRRMLQHAEDWEKVSSS